MVYDYVITLKKRNDSTIDAISQLMYLFAIAAFGYFAYVNPYARTFYLAIIFLILVTWIYCIIKKQKTGHVLFRLGLFFATVGWLLYPVDYYVLAIAYGIAGLIEKQVKFPDEIGFSEEHVTLNTFPRKKIGWSELANVVLKDNMLTVDFKNNKLIQKELDEEVSTHTEKEFNDFCQSQLSKVVSGEVAG
jgi:hypothetical protein